jgi:hypothetical protein
MSPYKARAWSGMLIPALPSHAHDYVGFSLPATRGYRPWRRRGDFLPSIPAKCFARNSCCLLGYQATRWLPHWASLLRASKRSCRKGEALLQIRLSCYFGNSPEFWLNLQQRYELECARRELVMRSSGFILALRNGCSMNKRVTVLTEVCFVFLLQM